MRGFLILAVLGVAASAAAEPEPDSEEQLVIDAHNALALPPRIAHHPPEIETPYWAIAKPILRGLAQLHLSKNRDHVEAYLKSRTARESLNPSEQQVVANAFADALRGVEASRGRDVGVEVRLQIMTHDFDDMWLTTYGDGWTMPSLLAHALHDEIDRGLRPEALQHCLDALAFSRDAMRTGFDALGPGHRIAVATVEPCVVALHGASVGEIREFRLAASTMTSQIPTLQAQLARMMAFVEVILFHDKLSEKTLQELPTEVLSLSSVTKLDTGGAFGHLRHSVFGGWARRTLVATFRQAMAASLQPPATCEAQMEDLDEENEPGPWLDTSPTIDRWAFVSIARSQHGFEAAISVLNVAARVSEVKAETGHWPKDWPEAGIPAPIDPRSGLPMHLVVTGASARIQPQPDPPRTDDDLAVTLQ